MRSMAFSGAGAGIGAVAALLLGFSRQDAMIAALVLAIVFVLGFANKKTR